MSTKSSYGYYNNPELRLCIHVFHDFVHAPAIDITIEGVTTRHFLTDEQAQILGKVIGYDKKVKLDKRRK